jgi:acetyl esterase/lipase
VVGGLVTGDRRGRGVLPGRALGADGGRLVRLRGQVGADPLSEEDGTSSAEGIQQAWSGIQAAGGDVEVFDYPGTHHAFVNDTRPEVHDAAASAQAWSRMLALFRRRLTA